MKWGSVLSGRQRKKKLACGLGRAVMMSSRVSDPGHRQNDHQPEGPRMTDVYIPTLTHATERDIDLLLVEEIYANVDFVAWLSARAGFDRKVSGWDVKHSKRRTRSRREIDIFVEVTLNGGDRVALLIENKIDAGEQPDQAESYRDELNVLASDYQASAMVLVCPEGYRLQQSVFASKFDLVLAYEELRDWFAEAEREAGNEAALRFRLRAELMDQAINKHRRGYTAIPDKVVGDFNALYVRLLAEVAPEIVPGNSMLKPANPRESTSMIFDQERSFDRLPKDIRPRRFAHELGRGSERRANYVAVTFAGWGTALPRLKEAFARDTVQIGAEFFAKPATKTRPNPGLVMLFPTEPVDNQADFDLQRDQIMDGIREARSLRKWLCENVDVLVRWKGLVERSGGGD